MSTRRADCGHVHAAAQTLHGADALHCTSRLDAQAASAVPAIAVLAHFLALLLSGSSPVIERLAQPARRERRAHATRAAQRHADGV